MKMIMLGNEAVARGLYDAGVCFASSYPGTPSTEITAAIAKYEGVYCEWAPNEKVSLEAAWGASLGGRRAFSGMKHVGLNVAADPLFTMSYTGVNAGVVVAVADDPGMHSSQNEQDSRHYAVSSKVPMLEPSDSSECYLYTKYAYELSEEYDTPVLVRLCTRISHSQSVIDAGERVLPPIKPYEKNIGKNVMMPSTAVFRHPIVEERTQKLAALAEISPLNRIEWGGTDVGIICAGTSYCYVKEICGVDVSVLKLGIIYPMPDRMICEFASKVKKLIVVEELDPFIENHVKSLGIKCSGKDMLPICGEFTPNIVAKALGYPFAEGPEFDAALPVRPPVMCAGCSHRGVFYTLAKLGTTVFGDIGCYTLGAGAPHRSMDTSLCMGTSVSGLHGFMHAEGNEAAKNCVCVIGDSTFIHSGVTGLIDIAYNGGDSTVIILDNSTTGMTGHQENPSTGINIWGEPAGKIDLEALCRSLGIKRVRVTDPYDLAACETAIKEETAAKEPSVIIARRPCALLKKVKNNPPLFIDEDKCRGCMMCMKIGCPALTSAGKKIKLDATLCVGCEVCTQLCKFEAFKNNRAEADA
ncbi:MAG: indolepyruvate ferredoxin oxidoreductase subunit alpha [Defluviitaleaceae bacterium]|nr:indolepyruvate ferredoxin oxidoreductase subunit alpha [Defluviitaleaceae bacterium]